MLPVAAEHRISAVVSAGDQVDVRLVPDTAPHAVTVPVDLALALEVDPAVRTPFDALSYSHRRRHVLQVKAARTPATRARRVMSVIEGVAPGGRPPATRPREASS